MQTYVSREKCIRVKYSLRSSHLSPRDLHISAIVYFPTCTSASERCARKYSILSPNKSSNLFLPFIRPREKKNYKNIPELTSITGRSENKRACENCWKFLKKLILIYQKFCFISRFTIIENHFAIQAQYWNCSTCKYTIVMKNNYVYALK